jgi:hypothetical protein
LCRGEQHAGLRRRHHIGGDGVTHDLPNGRVIVGRKRAVGPASVGAGHEWKWGAVLGRCGVAILANALQHGVDFAGQGEVGGRAVERPRRAGRKPQPSERANTLEARQNVRRNLRLPGAADEVVGSIAELGLGRSAFTGAGVCGAAVRMATAGRAAPEATVLVVFAAVLFEPWPAGSVVALGTASVGRSCKSTRGGGASATTAAGVGSGCAAGGA